MCEINFYFLFLLLQPKWCNHLVTVSINTTAGCRIPSINLIRNKTKVRDHNFNERGRHNILILRRWRKTAESWSLQDLQAGQSRLWQLLTVYSNSVQLWKCLQLLQVVTVTSSYLNKYRNTTNSQSRQVTTNVPCLSYRNLLSLSK